VSLLKQVAGLFATRVVLRVLNLLIVLLLARWLGPEGQGVFSFIVMMALLLAGIGQLGLDVGVVYFIRAHGVASRALMKAGMPLLLLTGLLLIFAVAVLRQFNALPFLAPYENLVLFSGALLLVNECVALFLRSFLIAAERFERMNLLDAVQGLLQLTAVFVALWIDPSPGPALFAYVCARVAGSLLFARALYPHSEGRAISGHELLAYSRFPWLGNLFSMLNVRVDTLMLGWFLGLGMGVSAEDLGLYTVCALAINAIKEIQLAVQKVFLPKVSAAEEAQSKDLTARLYRQSFLVYLLLGAAVIILSRPVLILFGNEYLRAWKALTILVVGVVMIRANGGLLSLHLTACGRPELPPRLNAFGVGLNVLLNLFLIPKWGIEGAASATALSAMIVKWLFIASYTRQTGQGWAEDLFLRREDCSWFKSRFVSMLRRS
jgi:O-antigen/teichoic acid export membrane protein